LARLSKGMSSVDPGASRQARETVDVKFHRSGDTVVHVVFSRAEPAAAASGGDEGNMQKSNGAGGGSGDRPHAGEPQAFDHSDDRTKAGPSEVEPAMVDRSMQAQLGRHLRALYDDVSNEPIPDRLLKLLDELENKETKR